ncbi:MAG: phage holin family protein [Ardenticatenaceae bacterium]|nr:phage holin family protein [Ardenticatenaceae bacterium]
MKLIVRLVINALALWIAIELIPGFNFEGSNVSLLIIALIFGLVNAMVRPLILLLTCPLVLLTLGLFILVVNTIMLSLTVWLSGPEVFGLGLTSQGFWTTFLAAVVISIVSGVMSALVKDDDEKRDRR